MLGSNENSCRRYPKFTVEQIVQKTRVDNILETISRLQETYDNICENCNHIIPRPPILLPQGKMLPAICCICQAKIGRMCHYSLDNVCHFDVEAIDGEPSIKLLDGTIYNTKNRFPIIHHSKWCLFCEEWHDAYC